MALLLSRESLKKLSLVNIQKTLRADPSLCFLIFSNIATIVFAVGFNWSVYEVMFVYWMQSVIIGFFNVLKMLAASVYGKKASGFFLIPFFIFHYGLFHLVYLVFLISFLRGAGINIFAPAILFSLGITAGLFFINHLTSFVQRLNVIKKTDPQRLFGSPYGRIIPMHITIIFGSLLFALTNANLVVLLFFMFFKTTGDVLAHLATHADE